MTGMGPSCARAASRMEPRWAGSRCALTITSAATPCRSREAATSASSAVTVAARTEIVPGKASAKGAAV